mgnify:CR=1 FL=1
MSYETILVERRGQTEGILWITLNRPDRLNALVSELYAELNEVVWAARDDRSVRCIVITGAGRGFCAGADHKERGDQAPPGGGSDLEHGRQRLIRNAQALINLRRIDVPVIASINAMKKRPDLTLISGDLTDTWGTDEVRRFKHLAFEQLKTPVYVTVAGHIEDSVAYTDCRVYGPKRAQLLDFAAALEGTSAI